MAFRVLLFPARPEGPAPHAAAAAVWPFRRDIIGSSTGHIAPDEPTSRRAIHIPDLHEAFPAGQTAGTRLVLTQSSYQLQRWLDWLDAHPGVEVAASADPEILRRVAPDAFAGRGPWSRIELSEGEAAAEPPAASAETPGAGPVIAALAQAFQRGDPEVRGAACRAALDAQPDNPALHLAAASVAMELQQLDEAHDALTRAVQIAPDWEAVHFELGKLWLRAEAMENAAEAFAEAARLMPSFSAALLNLGAVLGELERGDEALAALEQALRYDPRGFQIVNNIGAVHREAGRLPEAEAAFRQVIDLAPEFVFGYYNLGHALFLQGRFHDSAAAYGEGMTRDPQKNPRQGSRLAIVRAAAGDTDGAIAILESIAERVPPEAMAELMEEAESTLEALSAVPGLDAAGLARVHEVVRRYSE